MSDAEIMGMYGLADSALQIAGNITASTFNYKHTKELAKWQNDMNIENWHMQNEYNSPSAQMARLKAAGLNPNLMYGQGNTGNAGSIPGVSASSHNEVKNPFEGIQLAGMYQQVKNAALEGKEKEAGIIGQRMRNAEEEVKLRNLLRKFNAIQVFKYDKMKGSDGNVPLYGFTNEGRLYLSDHDNIDAYERYRHTPEYKDLQLKWQRGEINEKNIGLLSQQEESRSRTANTNAAFDRVLSGEGSLEDWLRVIGEGILHILGGFGGSWNNGPKNPGTTINF